MRFTDERSIVAGLTIQERGERAFAYVFAGGHAGGTPDLVRLIDRGWNAQPLVDLLLASAGQAPSVAAFIVAEADPGAVAEWAEAIVQASWHPNPRVRRHALEALVRQPSDASRDAAFVEALGDDDEWVASVAAWEVKRWNDVDRTEIAARTVAADPADVIPSKWRPHALSYRSTDRRNAALAEINAEAPPTPPR